MTIRNLSLPVLLFELNLVVLFLGQQMLLLVTLIRLHISSANETNTEHDFYSMLLSALVQVTPPQPVFTPPPTTTFTTSKMFFKSLHEVFMRHNEDTSLRTSVSMLQLQFFSGFKAPPSD